MFELGTHPLTFCTISRANPILFIKILGHNCVLRKPLSLENIYKINHENYFDFWK
jgi:hypothetical protein